MELQLAHCLHLYASLFFRQRHIMRSTNVQMYNAEVKKTNALVNAANDYEMASFFSLFSRILRTALLNGSLSNALSFTSFSPGFSGMTSIA